MFLVLEPIWQMTGYKFAILIKIPLIAKSLQCNSWWLEDIQLPVFGRLNIENMLYHQEKKQRSLCIFDVSFCAITTVY